jgi:hypothetical protein
VHDEGLTPLLIDQEPVAFGGLELREDPQDVPVGRSPECQDVDFQPGQVFTRPGLSLLASIGSPILSMKEYVALDSATRRLLILSADGVLTRENGDLSFTVLESHLTPGARFKSDTLFGREWIAFSNEGRIGSDRPRSYYLSPETGESYLDRVSTGPPGANCVVSDSTEEGSITAGVHKYRVIFETRSGYRTAFSPPGQWTAAGGKKANALQVPIGPEAVVKRIIAFTRAGDERLFFLPGTAMEIKNNTDVAATGINFTDEELGAAVSVDDLFTLITLPPVAGFKRYGNRLVSWGALNMVQRIGDAGPLNFGFDGGFSTVDGGFGLLQSTPLGWNQTIAGASKSNPPGAVGDCVRFTGDGVSQRGRLVNTVKSVGVIEPGRGYSVRIRATKSSDAAVGSVFFYMLPTDNSEPVYFVRVDCSELTAGEWTVLDKVLITAEQNASVLTTWEFRWSTGRNPDAPNVMGLGDWIDVNYAQPYPTNEPTLPSVAFVSRADDPESVDALTGLLFITENDGQALRTFFVLRNSLYAVKDRSTHRVYNNGQEPGAWDTSEEVSTDVGTPSIEGVDTTDGWALLASRAGLYVFAGGFPVKISAPLQSEILTEGWKRINWKAPWALWVRVDNELGRIQVGVPLDGATTTSHIFMARYFNDPTKADWCLWNISANVATFSERTDGSRLFLYGDGTSAGRLLKFDKTVHNDVASAIHGKYRTAYLGGSSGRNLFAALTMNVAGAGKLSVSAFLPDGTTRIVLPSVTLYDPTNFDLEFSPLNVVSERVSWQIETNALNAYFKLRKFIPYLKAAPHTRFRGNRGL